MCMGLSAGAQKTPRADRLFFEYDYPGAISEYEILGRAGALSLQQRLNLAESYFKTRQYVKAQDQYLELFREDSLMANTHFNNLLQALGKISGQERVKAFLRTRSNALSNELVENADFNFELLEQSIRDSADYAIFRLNSNSVQMDLSPSFYGEDRLLFSSSRPSEKEDYFPSGEAYLSVFVGVMDPDGQVRNPEPINWLPESDYHQSTPFYSEALNGILYVRSNEENGEMLFDARGKNALAVALAGRNGQDAYLLRDPSTSFYYPFYDAPRGRLYFAADFPQGYGGTDIYYVVTNDGQIMSAPINLGPRINTPGNEIAPFIVGDQLYFASDVFYGLGGMDIYKATEFEDGQFSSPVNLGPELNTSHDEFGFILRQGATGAYSGYFTSNRPGGMGSDDLYGFRVSRLPGLRTLVVRGTVFNERNTRGLEKARVRLMDAGGQVLKEGYSREDGTFFLEIPWQDGVHVQVDKPEFTAVDLGSLGGGNGAVQAGKPLSVGLTPISDFLVEREGRTFLKSDRFYFPRGGVRMGTDITSGLRQAVEALRAFPDLRIRIEAHTDSRGSKALNQSLSERRARAIRDYLVSQGALPEQIVEVEGLGESRILNNCTDGVYCLEVLHKQNERYLLIVLNAPGK
ncbi:OmpA family protein [Robiginitalea sp. M366]|uniref:OmpA family protein n=1 Tax=Robiginitalea aestuariiviva TaxID=3036903 RepID=UPI00240E835B|nr:OmpA family protein [Robiginitalea aestuariiviva]MDG1570970.1 OmpA family protein [Robiginitalea aestuariiviva]